MLPSGTAGSIRLKSYPYSAEELRSDEFYYMFVYILC